MEYIDYPPEFVTDAECLEVLNELISREPLFHHPEFGTTREDFENMTDLAFWEVGASGRRYSREYTLAEVVKRYENPQYLGIHSLPENAWETKDFYCREIATNTYLLTYTLIQGRSGDSSINSLATCQHGLENSVPSGNNCTRELMLSTNGKVYTLDEIFTRLSI